MKDLSTLTREELIALIEKRRKYQREYRCKPEVKAKQREYQREYERRPAVRMKQREYYRKIKAGYEAAKKAGLI